MCFLNLHFGPLFWHLFRPKTTPQKVEFSTPKVKKSEFLTKKVKKVTKKVKKREVFDKKGPPKKVEIFQNPGSKSWDFRQKSGEKREVFGEVFGRKVRFFEKGKKKEENLTNFWVTTGRHHPTCWSFFSKVSWMPGFRHAHTLQQLQIL